MSRTVVKNDFKLVIDADQLTVFKMLTSGEEAAVATAVKDSDQDLSYKIVINQDYLQTYVTDAEEYKDFSYLLDEIDYVYKNHLEEN